MVGFVLLHPEICLGFPLLGLLVLTELRMHKVRKKQNQIPCLLPSRRQIVPGQ